MKIISNIAEIRQQRMKLPEPVGFIPTMGFLHEGHLSLIRNGRKACSSVVVSIFVNPAQFGPAEDLSSYPRDLKHDLKLLEKEGVDIAWVPREEILYPSDFQTWISVDNLSVSLEGRSRPGHFRGVATIVAKLLNVVQPHKVYFGQKDAQQVAIMKQMVKDLNFPVEIVTCETIRDTDGLAMSSRNSYLVGEERKAATVIIRSLRAGQRAFECGLRDGNQIRQIMKQVIDDEPLAQIDYVSCSDPLSLQELDIISDGALLSLAVIIGKTRLIDNILLSQ
ncbi:MAG: pantoate--beta-alanine ligase [Anaerolineaceae bacterium]|nr:pantoate--beta-alanine ligase [Anaerolineaceae bacterium]